MFIKYKGMVNTVSICILILTVFIIVWFFGFNRRTDVDTRFYESGNSFHPNIKTKGLGIKFNFAFCGDPHVEKGISGNFPFLKKLILPYQIDFLVFPGDLTFQGKNEDYEMFNNLLDYTGLGYLVTVGNHDIYQNGWEYYKKFFSSSHYIFEIANTVFIVLDTAGGRLGDVQMSWLGKTLSSVKKEHIFVITHEPIFETNHGVYHISDANEREKLVKLLSLYHVDYVLQGHYHGFVTSEHDGVNYITSGSFGNAPLDNDVYHFLIFNVNGTNITYKKIDIPNSVNYRDEVL